MHVFLDPLRIMNAYVASINGNGTTVSYVKSVGWRLLFLKCGALGWGHIELASPVAHIWFLKSLPSRLSLFLGLSLSNLERILYFESYIVVEVEDQIEYEDDTGKQAKLEVGDILTEEKYQELRAQYQNQFRAGMGAETILEMINNIDIADQIKLLRQQLSATRSETNKKKLFARLKVLEAFHDSKK